MDSAIVTAFVFGGLCGFCTALALNVKSLVEAYIQLDEYRRKVRAKND